MFNSISKKYDFLNHFLSFGQDIIWRKLVVKELIKQKPGKILDLATGTGDLAIITSKKLPQAEIYGIDNSPNMLSIAKNKINNHRLSSKIKISQGDAENLPYENNYFDAITLAFGIRNFCDINKALEEIKRVLKDNGYLYILEFSIPPNKIFKFIYLFYFKKILPIIGRLFSRDKFAYKYLVESVITFNSNICFIKKLRYLNFKNIRVKLISCGICTLYIAEK